MTRTLLALAAVLAWGGTGCKSEADAPPASAEADAEDASPAADDASTPEVPPPASRECRDWSKLDLTTLPPPAKSPYVDVLEQVWKVVLEKHYDPTLGCIDWPAKRLEYAQRLRDVEARREAYQVIDDMLQELGQSHFRLFGADAHDAPPHGPASPPMQVRWIDDELVVVDSEATGHLGPVLAGAAVLAIDETPVADIVGPVAKRTERPTERAFEIARAAEAYLSCSREGQHRKLRVTDPTQDDHPVVRIVECQLPQGELVTLGNLRDIPTRVDYRLIDKGPVGYLAFNVWMLPMVERVKKAMGDMRAQGMEALVLDLRGNPGGVGPMSVPVARLILSKAGSLGALKFREFTQEFKVEPEGDPFTGPVAVLVDEGTASTSEIFAQGLQDLGRVTVVGGGPSAGVALPSLIEELPGGAVLQYVVGDYHSPKGTVVEGKGVQPDLLVDENREDFAAGHDPVLEAAVAHVTKQLAASPAEEPTTP